MVRKTLSQAFLVFRTFASANPAHFEPFFLCSDPSYNPTVSASGSKPSSSVLLPPRISLLLVDNISAFKWQTHGQPVGGSSGIAGGLFTQQRISVGAGAIPPDEMQAMGTGPGSQLAAMERLSTSQGNSWFYELFTHRARDLMTTYSLVGVFTKATLSARAVSTAASRTCCVVRMEG